MSDNSNIVSNIFVPAFGAVQSEIEYLKQIEFNAFSYANACASVTFTDLITSYRKINLPVDIAYNWSKFNADCVFFLQLQYARMMNHQHIEEIVFNRHREYLKLQSQIQIPQFAQEKVNTQNTLSKVNTYSKINNSVATKIYSSVPSKASGSSHSDDHTPCETKTHSKPKPISTIHAALVKAENQKDLIASKAEDIFADFNSIMQNKKQKKLQEKPVSSELDFPVAMHYSKPITWKRIIGADKLDAFCNTGYKNSETKCIDTPFDFRKKCKAKGVSFYWDRTSGTVTLSSLDRDQMNIFVPELIKMIDSFGSDIQIMRQSTQSKQSKK